MGAIISNVEDVKLIISKYQWLEKQAERLVDDQFFDDINYIDFDNNDLHINYSTYCKGCSDRDFVSVPIEWLFLSDGELSKVKEEKRRQEEEERQRQKELKEALEKQAQEQKDRIEYERLKKKFEGGE